MRSVWGATLGLLTMAIGAGALAFNVLSPAPLGCERDNAGLTLPDGFCAGVFADDVGVARHLVVAPNGDVYVNLENASRSSSNATSVRGEKGAGALLALRDTSGDLKADIEVRVPTTGGTGIALRGRDLWVSTETSVLRFKLDGTGLGVSGSADTIVSGFPTGGHRSRSLTLDDAGHIFVNVGSSSNACRTSREVPRGEEPCSELKERSGVWRYDAGKVGQRHPDGGVRWATGIRNAVGLSWSSRLRGLYAVSHGRDGLHQISPAFFSAEQNAEKPSEEFMRVERGQDYGWPYCFHDPETNKKVLAPEYGGNGKETGRCEGKSMPLIGFPGHWGPNGLVFYTAEQFPRKYHGGAFIAFHGSWNRMPLPEAGYKVVFAPFVNDRPTGTFEVFADGFAAGELEPIRARHRPMGLALGPDGTLYISDDQRGRIYIVKNAGRN